MALATVRLTCQRCGREIVKRKECRNCAKADEFKEWAAHHIKFCRDCQHEMEYEQSLEETKDLPALEGTEKQIRWATCIRAEFKRTCMRKMQKEARIRRERIEKKENGIIYELVCKNYRKAAWWINNQYNLNIYNLFGSIQDLLQENAGLEEEYNKQIENLDE